METPIGDRSWAKSPLHERPIPTTTQACHQRVRRLWGTPDNYPCINDCGKQAKDWAYDGTDPGEVYLKPSREGKTIRPCSLWPEFYMPMCRQCHKTRDGKLIREELTEYREWKARTGLKLRDLPAHIYQGVA